MNPIIIGGGISGLSAAYYLRKSGIPSTIIEARPRLGGVIHTEHTNGCVVEHGPDSFLAAKPWAMDLIRDLGLESEVISSNDHLRNTFIWKRGRLLPIPPGLQFLVPARFLSMAATPLFGWSTKLRMVTEPFRRFEPGESDESVAEFVGRHYGRELVDYLAEPLLSGIYGGDPAALSVQSVLPRFAELEKKYGSLTRGVLAERSGGPGGPLFQSLKNGLGQLVEALAPMANVRRGRAEVIERQGAAFRVRVNGEWMAASHVVIACEAWQAARVVSAIDGRLGELLGQIACSSSTIVALGFERRAVPHPLNGFGFLVPGRERRSLAACTWVGTKFPHRAPETTALLRCFAPGEPEALSMLDDLRRIMRIRAQPLFIRVARWPLAMAQYNVGHARLVAAIEERMGRLGGLFLAGNAWHGIGIPDCIRTGRQAAEQIAAPAKTA